MISISEIINVAWKTQNSALVEFFTGEESRANIWNFTTYLILYNNMIPISLYVTMDIVKVVQTKFI